MWVFLVVFLKSGKMLWHCNGWESILKMPKEDDLIDKSLYPSRIFSWSWLTLKPVRDDHQAAQVFSLSFKNSNIRFQKVYNYLFIRVKTTFALWLCQRWWIFAKNRPDQNINHGAFLACNSAENDDDALSNNHNKTSFV